MLSVWVQSGNAWDNVPTDAASLCAQDRLGSPVGVWSVCGSGTSMWNMNNDGALVQPLDLFRQSGERFLFTIENISEVEMV
jgi:hypothetical protein